MSQDRCHGVKFNLSDYFKLLCKLCFSDFVLIVTKTFHLFRQLFYKRYKFRAALIPPEAQSVMDS